MALDRAVPSRLGRVIAAGVVGSTLEFYDFFLYGALAATLFGPLFFPAADGLVGVLYALLTYAVGFVARPVGGLFFGHFGDRIGRRPLLSLDLLIMGSASVLIGILPTYHQIGVLAPILLTVLRLAQGFAIAGLIGAVVLIAEHGRADWRGLNTSWVNVGAPLGNMLATGALALTAAAVSEEILSSWAWRVPFLVSILLVAVGIWVRFRIAESPMFQALRQPERAAVERRPLVAVLASPRELLCAFGAKVGESATFYVFTIFLLVYARSIGVSTASAAAAVTLGSLAQAAAMPLGGALSDRWGRRPVALAATTGIALWAVPFFDLVSTGQPALLIVGVVVALFLQGVLNGAQAAFYYELFTTSVRYSGVAIGTGAGAVLAGGVAPLVAVWLFEATASVTPVILLLLACLLATAAGMLFAAETRRTPLAG